MKAILKNFNALSDRFVFVVLFFTSFFLRLPFFFRDYIDRDESTFILIGQSWVEGHLPYTELWDIKPPVTFLFFAAIIYSFGKSFFAIRLVGALLVSITAFFTYKIGVTLTSKKVALWSAVFCVLLQSLFGSIQGVMSEHITMAFFVPAVYVIVKSKNTFWYLISGLLMGVSLMTKLNIAYAALLVGIFICYKHYRKHQYTKGFIRSILYGTGIITIIALTILPYYMAGIWELWYKSVIQAALEYAGARRYSILKMAPTFLPIITFFIFSWKKKLLDFKNTTVQLVLVIVIGVLFSFVKGGRINSHYLIQLYPLLLVLVGIVLSKISIFKNLNPKVVLGLLVLLPMESYLEYFAIVKNKIERGTFYNGEGITVPNYLMEHGLETKNVFFTEYHIGYWVLGAKPPTKAATHPSNIGKPEMFPFYDNPRKTFMAELSYILNSVKPQIIVVRKNRAIFDPINVIQNSYINAYLENHYALLKTIDKAQIYTRLKRK